MQIAANLCFFIGRSLYNRCKQTFWLEVRVSRTVSRSLLLRVVLPLAAILIALGAGFGVLHMRSASPVVDRSALQMVTVESGPMICRVEGLGTLVPEDVRWVAAGTEGRVDEIYLRPGAHVKPDTPILQLSNPDLVRQITDAELAMKKSEAELANLRVQLQAQLLNEKALEAQLESEEMQAKLEADRDESLFQIQVGASMNAKISRARANSMVTRLQIEKEKLGIAEEARQAQLTAKQAEVSQLQSLYDFRDTQRQNLLVRAGMDGVLEEVSVASGQQVGPGTNLARVTNSSRLMARIHIPEGQASQVEMNQAAVVILQDKKYPARVAHLDPNVQNGTVSIDLKFTGAQPREGRSDLSASGSIEIEKIARTLFVDWPLRARADEPISLFRITDDGRNAERVSVTLGRTSTDSVQIAQGLRPGDRIIVSDMTTWKRYDRLQLK
jgi:HlyD family secretion protein